MSSRSSKPSLAVIKRRVQETREILKQLGFGSKQSNETAAHSILAILGLSPDEPWSQASNPLMGITPIIEFVHKFYRKKLAPNTRETVRDEAIKYFVEYGLVVRNPDAPERATNSGKTVYQIEPSALALFRKVGTNEWIGALNAFLASGESVRTEIERKRILTVIPVTLPNGDLVTLSAGGQNPLMKKVVEEFCPRFVPGGTVVYLGDTSKKFALLNSVYLASLGTVLSPSAKMPDVVIHDVRRDWLVLVEVVATAGPIDGKRRKELKELFAQSSAGLVFVTAFSTRRVMQSFLGAISWETEVWVADHSDHLIHFNGERFLGPYPDVARSE